MAVGTTDIDTYRDAFARLEEGADARRASWIHGLRRDAFARFAELGFPNLKQEDYRHTNIEPIRTAHYQRAGEASAAALAELAPFEACPALGPRLAFVNGRFAPTLSRLEGVEDGVRVGSIADILETEPDLLGAHLGRYANTENAAFAALNTAFLEDGAYIHIGRWREAREPITILNLRTREAEPTAAYPRALIVAEEGSVASVIEIFSGPEGAYMNDAVTEIVVGAGASLDHVKMQREGMDAHHVATMAVRQETRSRFTSHAITLGAALARNNFTLRFDGPEAEGALNGLYAATGRQHIDTHTIMDHAYPNCNSHQTYRGILDDRARGVFAGRIIVRPDAQKTDAWQNSRALLLSREAMANALPQLEIFADDVKCTHGATVGALDEDSIFYLRARGIPEPAARGLLIHAFAGVVLDTIPIEPLRERLVESMFARFTGSEDAA